MEVRIQNRINRSDGLREHSIGETVLIVVHCCPLFSTLVGVVFVGRLRRSVVYGSVYGDLIVDNLSLVRRGAKHTHAEHK